MSTVKTSFASFATALLMTASASADVDVVASIKPVHSLVSAVMEGAGAPKLLISGLASPHDFALKPSQASQLQNAKLVFWIGPTLETSLVKPISVLATHATSVELINSPGLIEHKFRHGGLFEANSEVEDALSVVDDHAGHDHDDINPHIWLDPRNAIAMTAQIETSLAKADPDNAGLYKNNSEKLRKQLHALDISLAKELKPVEGKPYFVFHDAYEYFEDRYHVPALGSLTFNPEIQPGARRLDEIQDKINQAGVVCLFSEIQFKSNYVKLLLEGTKAKTAVLDPLGSELKPGPNLYPEMMQDIAREMVECLEEPKA
ncbi:zinc ABC transporter substrate-binding protein [Flexibacterium corallicola]|uniref:zinc ABC transporter substrate-binding protein n=1 Tax=Flexibacterium corallicola TaxID=3037259 RepID=UPI00286F50C9|nr:zinc ABC transporter substrate-binding protein [Pseudovibrio sp. M1P-2-3]